MRRNGGIGNDEPTHESRTTMAAHTVTAARIVVMPCTVDGSNTGTAEQVVTPHANGRRAMTGSDHEGAHASRAQP